MPYFLPEHKVCDQQAAEKKHITVDNCGERSFWYAFFFFLPKECQFSKSVFPSSEISEGYDEKAHEMKK